MLPNKYLNKIKKTVITYSLTRREVIKESGDALHNAKKAIFALHRDDIKTANKHLDLAAGILKSLNKRYKKSPKIQGEGSYKAAVEEFVEATLFSQFLKDRTLTEISVIDVADEVYVAGMADVPGELYRYSLKAGTEKDMKTVQECKVLAAEIVEMLIEFDLTKQLRVKFDQAKSALHKIERVVYELSS